MSLMKMRGTVPYRMMMMNWRRGSPKAYRRLRLNDSSYADTMPPTNAATKRVQGDVGQETLTQVISRDELDPRRKRSPWLSTRINWPYKPPFPTGVSITLLRF